MIYLPPLLRVAKRLGYAVSSAERDWIIDLVTVRRSVSHRKPDLYCDDFYAFWRQDGGWRCFIAPCNSSPGSYFRGHPMRPSQGCAIMAAGQYRSAFFRGPHKGRPALLHRGARIKYYRDHDPLDVRELDPAESRGVGFHIHRGTTSDRVGRWSTGAQTLKSDDMDTLINLCDKQVTKHGFGLEAFTYTLIEESQIWDDK